MATTMLKPGLLVSLHTELRGGAEYSRVDLETKGDGVDGAAVDKWETTKIVEDPEEYERAIKVRGKAGNLIRAVCTKSHFGLLCPTTSEDALDKATVEAKLLVDTFNATARLAHVSIYALKGRIAENDNEATRAISMELRGLMDQMESGIKGADVKSIRDAANKARQIGQMLDADTSAKVSRAISEARGIAKELTKKLVADAGSVSKFVAEVNMKALTEARFAFLDMDVELTQQESLPLVEARGLDIDDDDHGANGVSMVSEAASVYGRKLDL